MEILQQILFLASIAVSVALFSKKIKQIRRNIFLGQPEVINDHYAERWKNVLLLAFGQKKCSKIQQ